MTSPSLGYRNHSISALLFVFILGSVHTVLTPLFYKTFDLDALWFAGTGLAFVFLGFINFTRIRTSELVNTLLCLFGNVLALIFCICFVTKLAEPQAYISLFVLLFLFSLSLIDVKLKKNNDNPGINHGKVQG